MMVMTDDQYREELERVAVPEMAAARKAGLYAKTWEHETLAVANDAGTRGYFREPNTDVYLKALERFGPMTRAEAMVRCAAIRERLGNVNIYAAKKRLVEVCGVKDGQYVYGITEAGRARLAARSRRRGGNSGKGVER
ncbi:MAG: hypothetical protein D6773_18515 [Alphaproteobacteria bacterium]|nr:MAG: hypothetical protein D6773_18515 [Alphaproteobacteria bacterium]